MWCQSYVYAFMKEVLTFARLVSRRSNVSSFSDALFSKAAAVYCIRQSKTGWSQGLTGSYAIIVLVHLGLIESMEVQDGTDEPFQVTPYFESLIIASFFWSLAKFLSLPFSISFSVAVVFWQAILCFRLICAVIRLICAVCRRMMCAWDPAFFMTCLSAFGS